MNIKERNMRNISSRWKKKHDIELTWINSHKNTNYLKARICGYLAGDGNISIRKEKTSGKIHHEIKFFPDHVSLIAPYLRAFIESYNKIPKVTKKHNFYEVRINSKVIVNDLLALCSFGITKWTILKFDDAECKKEWLRAIFDSDAYVGSKSIRIKTVNKNGLESIKDLLYDLGIETSKIYIYIPKNKNWSANYILDVRKIESMKRFSRVIGFNHKLKEERLLKIIK
jgi:hypothetical protein